MVWKTADKTDSVHRVCVCVCVYLCGEEAGVWDVFVFQRPGVSVDTPRWLGSMHKDKVGKRGYFTNVPTDTHPFNRPTQLKGYPSSFPRTIFDDTLNVTHVQVHLAILWISSQTEALQETSEGSWFPVLKFKRISHQTGTEKKEEFPLNLSDMLI